MARRGRGGRVTSDGRIPLILEINTPEKFTSKRPNNRQGRVRIRLEKSEYFLFVRLSSRCRDTYDSANVPFGKKGRSGKTPVIR